MFKFRNQFMKAPHFILGYFFSAKIGLNRGWGWGFKNHTQLEKSMRCTVRSYVANEIAVALLLCQGASERDFSTRLVHFITV